MSTLEKLKVKTETNEWLTKGILTSCKEKSRLYYKKFINVIQQ